MQLIRFDWRDTTRWGALEGESVYALQGDVYSGPTRGERLCELSDVRLLAPAEPGMIVCCGVNFPATIERVGCDMPQEPVLFFKPPQSLCNPGEDTYTLPMSDDTRFESEICAVMKRMAWKVSPEEALDYVLGYTCGNDMTMYNLIAVDGRITRAKGFYKSAPLGPVLVTDYDPSAVRVSGRVNGVTVQDGNTRDMIFDTARIISHVSNFVALMPGDIVFTGTPEGGRTVNRGDTLEVEVEGIGTLTNRLVLA